METQILNYRIIIEPETYADGSKVYNAYCPSLGITDYGDSVEAVLESINDGITLALETLTAEGNDIPVDHIEEQIVTAAKITVPKNLRLAI